MLGLHCCTRFSPVVKAGDCAPGAVAGLLTAVAPLVSEHRLWSAGSVVVVHRLLLHGVWDLPRPGVKPMAPALAGFRTTKPPGEPRTNF